MLPQTQHSIKDWNLDIEETQAQHNWQTPITTTVDSWGVENMLLAQQHQLVGIDPSMQYSMMMNRVPHTKSTVPSYSSPLLQLPLTHMAPRSPFLLVPVLVTVLYLYLT
eukprot:TRINITY_DN21131_c0_g1_i1.p1 TRINITY_DN21131_c0_g1~~TRINITY_DN21131_c0_g1_i1.p1  ORF type:complete len:109 (+),score=2.33 TRINITY_DN21131_c0_g1_i1:427-753(+)